MRIEPYDRNSFLVRSGQSAYVVDLEERFCSCDSFNDSRQQENQPLPACKHFNYVTAFLAKRNKTQPKRRKACLVIL